MAIAHAPCCRGEEDITSLREDNPLTKVLRKINDLDSVEFENEMISFKDKILSGETVIDENQIQSISLISKFVNKNGKHYRIAFAQLYAPLLLTQHDGFLDCVKNAVLDLLSSDVSELRYTGLEQIVEILGQNEMANELLQEARKILRNEEEEYVKDYLLSIA